MSQSSKALDIYRRITTLKIIGGKDCEIPVKTVQEPDLSVRGGAKIEKTLCAGQIYSVADITTLGNVNVNQNVNVNGDLDVLGDGIIEGNLHVQGAIFGNVNVILSDVLGNICFISTPRTDEAANARGLYLQGPLPDKSKSFVWLKNPSVPGEGWWYANQDINLGQGQNVNDCADDRGLAGVAYRINGNVVLNSTTLGNGVIYSSLTSVGELNKGSINVGNVLSSNFPIEVGLSSISAGSLLIRGNITSENICAPNIFTDKISGKDGNPILITSSLIPADNTVTLGNVTNIWSNIYGDTVNLTNINALTGTVSINANILPSLDSAYDLGSMLKKWASLYVQDLYVCHEATIHGNLHVYGGITYISTETVVVTDNRIILNAAPIPGNDAGIFVCRYQVENDTCLGDVIQDVPQESGAVVSGTLSTVVLSPSIVHPDNYYRDWWIKISSGTGQCQVRKIKQYTAGSTTAIVNTDWTIAPDATSTYELFPCKFVVTYWDESLNTWAFACTANANVDVIPSDQKFLADLNVQSIFSGTIIPHENMTYDLGNLSNKWRTLYVANIDSCGTITTTGNVYAGNICITGELLVDHIKSKTGSLVIDDVSNLTVNILNAPIILTDQIFSQNGNGIQIEDVFINNDTIMSNVVISNTVVTESLGVINGATIGGNLSVFSNTYLTNLIVSGVSTFENTVTVDANLCVTETLFVDTIQSKTGGNLVLNSDVYINGNLFITGNTNIIANIISSIPDPLILNKVCANILQTNLLEPKLTGAGAIIVNGNLIPSLNDVFTLGNATNKFANIFTQDISTQNITIHGDQNVLGNVTIGGQTTLSNVTIENLSVNNVTSENETINGNLLVNGSSLFNSNVIMDANLCITQTLFVDNIKSKTGNNIVLNSDVYINGNLFVVGNTNIIANIIASIPDPLILNKVCANILQTNLLEPKLTGSGAIIVNGNLIPSLNNVFTLGNAINKFSNIFAQEIITQNIVTQNIVTQNIITQEIVVNGNESIAGNLIVLGKTTLSNVMLDNLMVNGSEIVNENLTVLGDTTLVDITAANITLSGNELINGNLTVLGKTTFANVMLDNLMVNGSEIINENLTVLGDTTLNNITAANITLSGNELVNGNLTVLGKTTLANVMLDNLLVNGT